MKTSFVHTHTWLAAEHPDRDGIRLCTKNELYGQTDAAIWYVVRLVCKSDGRRFGEYFVDREIVWIGRLISQSNDEPPWRLHSVPNGAKIFYHPADEACLYRTSDQIYTLDLEPHAAGCCLTLENPVIICDDPEGIKLFNSTYIVTKWKATAWP